MQFEAPVLITIIVLLVTMGIWLGKLWSDVQHNRKDIDGHKNDFLKEVESLRKENRDDHNSIFNKIDNLNTLIRNGKGNG